MNDLAEKAEGKIGGEPLVMSLGEGYSVEFTDYGIAGVMVRMFRPDWQSADREAAALIPKKHGDRLMFWLERTVGRDAMALPVQTLEILRGLLAKDGVEKMIPKADRNILKEAVKILEDINSLDASNFNTESRIQRALNR